MDIHIKKGSVDKESERVDKIDEIITKFEGKKTRRRSS